MMSQTGVDGVVVGRGCLGRPWLFADLAAAFEGRTERKLPALGEVMATMRRHAELLASWLGTEREGVVDFRKHVAWYLKGFPVGGDVRRGLAMSSSLAELDGYFAPPGPGHAVPGRHPGQAARAAPTPRARSRCPTAGSTTGTTTPCRPVPRWRTPAAERRPQPRSSPAACRPADLPPLPARAPRTRRSAGTPPGGFRRPRRSGSSALDRRDLQLELDLVADQHAAGLQRGVPGHAEVLAADRGPGLEADAGVAERVDRGAQELHVERRSAW